MFANRVETPTQRNAMSDASVDHNKLREEAVRQRIVEIVYGKHAGRSEDYKQEQIRWLLEVVMDKDVMRAVAEAYITSREPSHLCGSCGSDL